MRQLFYVPLHGPVSSNDQSTYTNTVSAPGACHAIGVAVRGQADKLILVVEGDDKFPTRSAQFQICGLMSDIPFEAGHIGTTSMVVHDSRHVGTNGEPAWCWMPINVYQLTAWE